MTIPEAIDLLDTLIGMVDDNQNNDYDEALKVAIRSLEAWGNTIQACNEVVPVRPEEKLGVAQIHAFVEWIEKGGSDNG